MKILVTGASGSLMQAVIPRLLDQGHIIIGIDINPDPKKITHKNYYHFINDLREPLVDFPCDAVIHAAAQIYGVTGFNERSYKILSEDVQMTINAVNHARSLKVKRFIYLSSSMVYEGCPYQKEGNHEDEVWSTGTYRVPSTGYGMSKYMGERLVEESGLEYIIWRPFNIITPYEKAGETMGQSHVFADIFKTLLIEKSNTLPLYDKGYQTRCFTWIEDVAQAISDYSFLEMNVSVAGRYMWMEGHHSSLNKIDQNVNTAFNIGTQEEVSIQQLAQLIHLRALKAGMNVSPVYTVFSRPGSQKDVKNRKPNIQKIYETFGWKPTLTLTGSIDKCIEYYKQQYGE